jgi:integrase
MASLRRVPRSPYWIACFTLPDGVRTNRSTGTADRRQAQRIANDFEDAADEAKAGRLTETRARKTIADIFAIGNKDALPSASVKDYLESWLKRKELEAGEATHARYAVICRQFLAHLGLKANRDLLQLTAKEFVSFRDFQAGKLSANSVNICLKVLRAAMAQAVRDGLIDNNEASRVSLLKREDKFQRRPFTLPELRRILEVADEEWRGLILFGLYTGQRLGDLTMLTWQNLDLGRRELRLSTEKTGRRQIIPLSKQLVQYVEKLPAGDDPKAPLFPKAYAVATDGTTSGRNSKQFNAILVQCGLAPAQTHVSTGKGRSARRTQNELSFHCLRHTATSLLKNAGVSEVVARDIIGHDSAAVSANYTHVDEDTKRKAVDMLPDIFLGK